MRYNYVMKFDELMRRNSMDNLSVLLDENLTFKSHINKIRNSGRAVFGFIKRKAREFDDPYITKTLYCSLFRSILVYASVIWCSHCQVHIGMMESVQKQFLLFA